jgi:hypothetical protein
MLTARELIERLGLEPLPIEGGIFRRTYFSDEVHPRATLPARYPSDRHFGSCIFNLHLPDSQQYLHRLLTDEVHHFYLGDPITFVMLLPDGRHEVRTLGPDLAAGHELQIVAPRGIWQGSCLVPGPHGYGLKGATMAPAFDFSDFELGDRTALLRQYPALADLIERLTPDDPAAILARFPAEARQIRGGPGPGAGTARP